jgi:hypothetical protein
MFNSFKVAAFAAPLVLASAAQAIPVSIGLQEAGYNSGNVTTEVNQNQSGSSVFAGSYGTFSASVDTSLEFNNLPYGDLNSTSDDSVSTGGAGTLKIYISEQNVFIPQGGSGFQGFLNAFTTNLLGTSGFTVTESTYLNSDNTQYSTEMLLGTATFTSGLQTSSVFDNPYLTQGEYSIVQVYTITASGAGSANNTIDTTLEAPEPASMVLLGSGLFGLGFLRRRFKI